MKDFDSCIHVVVCMLLCPHYYVCRYYNFLFVAVMKHQEKQVINKCGHGLYRMDMPHTLR